MFIFLPVYPWPYIADLCLVMITKPFGILLVPDISPSSNELMEAGNLKLAKTTTVHETGNGC